MDRPDVPPVFCESRPCVNSRSMSPWENPYVTKAGRCVECDQTVDHDVIGPDTPYTLTRVAHPHNRPVPGYVIEDAVACSCGGWQGTPVGPERVDNGAELLLLSFQSKVDDIEHNVENLVSLILEMKERLDSLGGDQ